MPQYTYIAKKPGRCRLCSEPFGWVGKDPEDLKECPRCGSPLVILPNDSVYVPKILHPISVSEAKSLGFQVFKKLGKGEYEKQ